MANPFELPQTPDLWNPPQLAPQFLPLNLDNLGIGTVNTFDSSKPGVGFVDVSPATAQDIPTAGAGAGAAASGGPAAPVAIGGIEGWFLRGTVIVLGFIFVAVGLAMFRDPGKTVIEATKGVVGKTA